MKSAIRKILLASLCVCSVACFAVGCGKSSSTANAPQGEAYEWTFDKPFAGELDDYMKIDGKLDEEVWQNKNYVGNSVADKSWQATTHFTARGLYVAVKATDETMTYKSRYSSRSAFSVYICKTGTQTYNLDNLSYHEGRCFQFDLDPYYCRSYGRVPYYYKAHVDGELNSETTCTMTAELFLTWEDLYYTEKELGENGYPEDIQMYVNYEGETSEILGTCLWREETYLHFNENGYKTLSEYDEDFANDINGSSSTDMWKKNADGNYYTTAGRAQILWLKNAYAKDFMFEAELKSLSTDDDGNRITMRGSAVYGRFGIINRSNLSDSTILTSGNKSVYTVYSAAASGAPATLQLQTCKQIDSMHWQNRIGVSGGSIKTGITDDYITLRIIKQGNMFYYFYGDKYWKCERIDSMQDDVYCGIFTSQGVEILDYTFNDYTDNESKLLDELSKYVYFIDVPGVSTYGAVETSAEAVAKGDAVTVKFSAEKGGILTQVTKNGVDVYNEIVSAMNENCEYTFTPTEDTKFGATFSRFSGDSLVKTVIEFNNSDGLVKDANYSIYGSEKLLYYSGSPNSSGYIIVYLPKAGEYEVDGKTFTVSGEYKLTATFSDNRDYESQFTLNDETTSVNIEGKSESVAKDKSFTYHAIVTENDWGTVIVNGVTVSGNGTLKYNEETGNYYIDGSVNRYYKTMVGDDEFELDVTLNVRNIGHRNNDLVGIQITNGKYLIVLKTHLENSSCLFIATGTGNASTSREICITGFGWTRTQDPTSLVKGSGEISFKVVKSGSAIYIYNADGVMRVRLDAEGVHMINGAQVVGWSSGALSSVNGDIQKFFISGAQVAVGVRTYKSTSIAAEFGLTYKTELSETTKAEIGYGAFEISLGKDLSLSDAYTVKSGYAIGETVKFAVDVKNGKKGKVQAIIQTDSGLQIVDGTYDSVDKCYTFSFLHEGGAIDVKIYILADGDMGWSKDWLDYSSNKDNTTPQEGESATKSGRMWWYGSWGEFVPTRENTTVKEARL